MDASSEAAEQIVRMTLEGTEVALRITGAGAKNAAAMLLAAAASNEKTKGRARLSAMLKSGRELRVFPIRFDDLKGFAKEARRYGIAYAVVKQKDGESVDLLVRTEDASKVNRIAERLGLCRMRDAPAKRRAAQGIGTMGARTPRRRRAPEQAAALLDDLLASPGDSDASL
ncbi:MAG: PcfB family protein [Eggerthellaceae bacterium]